MAVVQHGRRGSAEIDNAALPAPGALRAIALPPSRQPSVCAARFVMQVGQHEGRVKTRRMMVAVMSLVGGLGGMGMSAAYARMRHRAAILMADQQNVGECWIVERQWQEGRLCRLLHSLPASVLQPSPKMPSFDPWKAG